MRAEQPPSLGEVARELLMVGVQWEPVGVHRAKEAYHSGRLFLVVSKPTAACGALWTLFRGVEATEFSPDIQTCMAYHQVVDEAHEPHVFFLPVGL